MNEVSPFEKFHTFCRGMRDGFSTKAMRPEFTEHEHKIFRDLYDEGYQHGIEMMRVESKFLQKRFNYKPNILRTQTESEQKPIN